MGKYDWCFIQKKDGMYEPDHSFFHGGKGEGRQMIYAQHGLLGPNFTLGYGVIDAPYGMKKKPGFLDFDDICCFLSTNFDNLEDFDADIEFTIDGEKHVLSEPTIVRCPAYIETGPIIFKRVGKPFCFIHIHFTSSFHVPGQPDRRGERPPLEEIAEM